MNEKMALTLVFGAADAAIVMIKEELMKISKLAEEKKAAGVEVDDIFEDAIEPVAEYLQNCGEEILSLITLKTFFALLAAEKQVAALREENESLRLAASEAEVKAETKTKKTK